MAEVRLSGPLFDARARRVTRAMADEIEQEIADRGVNEVRMIVQRSAVERTGNYERHVHTERAGAGTEVTDGGIVYGPWLEGTSRRNFTTRFRGFAAMRRTAQSLQRRAESIATPVVRRRIGGLQ